MELAENLIEDASDWWGNGISDFNRQEEEGPGWENGFFFTAVTSIEFNFINFSQ